MKDILSKWSLRLFFALIILITVALVLVLLEPVLGEISSVIVSKMGFVILFLVFAFMAIDSFRLAQVRKEIYEDKKGFFYFLAKPF